MPENSKGSRGERDLSLLAGQTTADYDRLYEEIHSLPGNAAALLAHNFLERRINQTIRFVFPNEGKQATALLGTNEKPGELSMRYQNDLAYCLGLYGEKTHRDINLLSKIRNRFAHTLALLDFDDEQIASRCRELTIIEWTITETPTQPRHRFLESIRTIDGLLWTGMSESGEFTKVLP